MSRTLSAAMQAVATADVVNPLYLLDMEFTSGSLYLWTGSGDLAFGSNTYVGVGDLLSIGSVQESADLTANGATVSLSGVKTSLLNLARDEPYQGRPLTIRLGAFDDNGDIIASPVIMFSGFMDVMTISDSGDTSAITVTAENKLIAFQQTAVRRYTAEDQKIDHPSDKGFEFVTAIQELQIFWGRPSPTSQGTGAGDGQRPDIRPQM